MLTKIINFLRDKFTLKDLWVLLVCLAFAVYKFANLTFRFGDGNAYFYMAQSLLHGVLPYRNFFFADPPGFLLFLVLFKPVFGNHWLWYQALPFVLEAVNAVIIYLWLKSKFSKLAWLAVPVYLFSFTVLATSDFSTGVQLTVLFSLLGWYLWEKNWPKFFGIFWALSILTKLYALPAFAGFLIVVFWKKQKWIFLGCIAATSLIILLPFFLSSPHGFIESIIIHQFHRPPGDSRASVWLFFLKHEWVLVALGIIGAFLKANRTYLTSFILSVIFFLLFRDLYYLYLAYLFPYLVIFAISLVDRLWQDVEIRPLAFVALVLFVWSVLGGFQAYQNSTLAQGRFLNVEQVADYLKTQNAHAEIYGSHEVAPLLALYSGKPLFGNYIDTNTQVFAARTLDLDQVSRAAAVRGVYLVARITDLPDYNIKDNGYEGYFSKEVFTKACTRLKFFPSTSGEQDNYIGIYDCQSQ